MGAGIRMFSSSVPETSYENITKTALSPCISAQTPYNTPVTPSIHQFLLTAFLDGKSCATIARTFNLSVDEVLAWYESDSTQATLRRIEALQLQQARIVSFSLLPGATGSLAHTSTTAGDLTLRTRAAANLVRLGLRFSAPPPKPPPLTMADLVTSHREHRSTSADPAFRPNSSFAQHSAQSHGQQPAHQTAHRAPTPRQTPAPTNIYPNSQSIHQSNSHPARQPVSQSTATSAQTQTSHAPTSAPPLLSRRDSTVSALRAATGAPTRRESQPPTNTQHIAPRPPDSIAVAEAQPSSEPNLARNAPPHIPIKSAA